LQCGNWRRSESYFSKGKTRETLEEGEEKKSSLQRNDRNTGEKKGTFSRGTNVNEGKL